MVVRQPFEPAAYRRGLKHIGRYGTSNDEASGVSGPARCISDRENI